MGPKEQVEYMYEGEKKATTVRTKWWIWHIQAHERTARVTW